MDWNLIYAELNIFIPNFSLKDFNEKNKNSLVISVIELKGISPPRYLMTSLNSNHKNYLPDYYYFLNKNKRTLIIHTQEELNHLVLYHNLLGALPLTLEEIYFGT